MKNEAGKTSPAVIAFKRKNLAAGSKQIEVTVHRGHACIAINAPDCAQDVVCRRWLHAQFHGTQYELALSRMAGLPLHVLLRMIINKDLLII